MEARRTDVVNRAAGEPEQYGSAYRRGIDDAAADDARGIEPTRWEHLYEEGPARFGATTP